MGENNNGVPPILEELVEEIESLKIRVSLLELETMGASE